MEYLFTLGILISFLGVIIGSILNRRSILEVLRAAGFKRRDLLIAIVLVLVFLSVELYLVRPTQLLFFDDAIYQAMAADLVHMGQAWMCNYGTPTACFSGQIFHEPIGLSFNIAIAFAVLGVHRRRLAYTAQLALASISVFMTFMSPCSSSRTGRRRSSPPSLLALTPIILVWAMPTNSDMATLAYSLISLFMLMVFMRKKNACGPSLPSCSPYPCCST